MEADGEETGATAAPSELQLTDDEYHNSSSQKSPTHSDLPLLLKIKQSSSPPDVSMTTAEPPLAQTTIYTHLSDSEDTNNIEVDVDKDDEDDTTMATTSTTPIITTHPRPSVINLAMRTSSSDPTPIDVTPTNHASTPTKDSPTHHHNGERPERMREWLVRMINSGRFLGLEWLDPERYVFRVPWVHAKKRDYNQERDAALFKEWAIHSGKYGDGSDVTTWKINFRCALNGLKDIIERKELEGPDCRVYQMLPNSSPGRRRKRKRPIIHYSEMMQLQTPPSDTPLHRNIRPKLELPLGQTLTIATPNDTTPTTPLPTTPIQLVPIVTCTANFPFSIPVATIQASPTTAQHFPLTPSPTLFTKYRPLVPQAFKLTSDGDTDTNHAPLPRQRKFGSTSGGSDRSITPSSDRVPEVISRNQFSPKSLVASPTTPNQPQQMLLQDKMVIPMYPPLKSGKVRWPPAQFADNPNALTIRIMYGSITVHMETVDCSNGCRIFYGPLHCRDILSAEEEEKLFGPLDAHQISISPRHPSPLASEIFRTLKRGLVVEAGDNSIYATALCRTVIYSGSSPMKNTRTLDKEERIKVFDYHNQFLPELKHAMDSRTAMAPKPYVIFSFGQHWGSDRPLTKNLITLIVTHCKALNDLKAYSLPIYDELLYEPIENQDIRIISPTRRDLDAEEFLNPSSASTPH